MVLADLEFDARAELVHFIHVTRETRKVLHQSSALKRSYLLSADHDFYCGCTMTVVSERSDIYEHAPLVQKVEL